MKKKPFPFLPLNEILKQELIGLAQGKLKNTVTLERRWNTIVGEAVALNAKVLYVKDEILHIGVQDSTWLYELGFMREAILKEITQKLPEMTVRDIRFRIVNR